MTITVTAQADPTSRLLESLNERQLEAATHDGGTLLILAGAGTGKTTTLVRARGVADLARARRPSGSCC